MMDNLLRSLNEVCSLLLPILGAAVLIYLIILLRKVIKTMIQFEKMAIDLNGKMEKLDQPLNTTLKLFESIDNIHAASIKGTNAAIDFILANFSNIMDWIKETINARNNKKNENQDINININDGKGE